MDDLEIFRKIGQCEDKEQMQQVIEEYNKSKKPKTNADRIRAMSDEDLAEFLDECENKGYVDSSVALDNYGKMLPMLEWLKQPAEVKDDA